MNFNKFAPLIKIEEQDDGTLLVHSLITAQQVDLDKEVCDYATTKEFYQKRAAENLQKTSVPGMTPSVMPIREMHQLKAIGAGRSIEYNDTAKTIHGLTHIVEPTAVLKFRSGVLIGFSQGGTYVKRWEDPDNPGCMRYTADPMEWSAVDAPCLPSALVDSMKGKTVTLVKAAGVTEEVALVIPPPEEMRLAKIENAIVTLTEIAQQGVAKATSDIIPVVEGDSNMAKLTDVAGFQKAAKTMGEHLAKHMEMHKALHEKMEGVLSKDHPIMKAHDAMMDHCEKCMKAAKDMEGGEEPEKAAALAPPSQETVDADAITKAVTAAVTAATAPLVSKVDELEKKLAKTPANVLEMPHSGAANVAKSIQADAEFAELVK